MKRTVISLIIDLASLVLKRRRVAVPAHKAYVNLGCGLRCVDGWINIDGSPTALLGSRRFSMVNKLIYRFAGAAQYYSFQEFDRIIRKAGLRFADLRGGIPFADAVADVLYASHFLEHLTKSDAKKFINECHRVLKKGGLLRIAVPDLDVAFAMYRDGKVNEMLDLFFYTSEGVDFSAHKYNYNFSTLSRLLKSVGFGDIVRSEYQRGACPNSAELDVYPEHSLYIECRKV